MNREQALARYLETEMWSDEEEKRYQEDLERETDYALGDLLDTDDDYFEFVDELIDTPTAHRVRDLLALAVSDDKGAATIAENGIGKLMAKRAKEVLTPVAKRKAVDKLERRE